MYVRVRPLGQELTRAERPRNSIQCGMHGWQWFIGRPARTLLAGEAPVWTAGIEAANHCGTRPRDLRIGPNDPRVLDRLFCEAR